MNMWKTTPAIHQCDTGQETNRHLQAFEGPSLFMAIAARVILIVSYTNKQETPKETKGEGGREEGRARRGAKRPEPK